MTRFSADWLALREPADTRARDAGLTAQLAQCAGRLLSAQPARPAHHPPSRFMDLACGTGANLRYLAPRVGGDQHWLLVDQDVALLEKIGAVAGCHLEMRHLDLTTGLHTLAFAPKVVVTASALLDLVSDRWLVRLVEQCCASRCPALFALSYDGRITLTPPDPDDEWIRQVVNRHQRGDKGFGPALGPGASQRTCELFREAGYHVHTARSDWHLLPHERSLQQCLLEGWAGAARELASNEHEADRCSRWLARRLEHVARATSGIIVGHADVLALPRE